MNKLFYNGSIYTMGKSEKIHSFLVENQKIIAINPDETKLTTDVKRIDLNGKTVLPGFHDGHMHFLCYAIDKMKADFFSCESLEDIAAVTHAYIKAFNVQPGQWIQGGGWNENNFKLKTVPTRHDLDKIAPNNPVIFTRACCSVAVANTKALEIAGILNNPPKMNDGEIILEEGGKAHGLLNERARFLIYDIIPNVDKSFLKKLILDYQEDCLKTGLTTVQTDDFKLWDASFPDILQAYFELDKEKKLKLRFIQQLRLVDHPSLDAFLKLGYKTGFGSDHFKIGAFKLLPDGSLGGKTAALREGYVGDEENFGLLTYTKSALYSLLEKAHLNGLQLAMHAIGDKTMDILLDCYEALAEKFPKDDPRFRIIHCQITTEDIIDRFAKNNIIADIQPLFIRADMGVAEQLLGDARTKWAYNWKTFLDKGVKTAGSSDAPVESFDPLLGIYSAVTRKDLHGNPSGGWLPSQKLSAREAVALYTTGSAYTAFEEKEKGQLEEGFLADFIVLSDDIFKIPGEEILNIQVLQSYVGGESTF